MSLDVYLTYQCAPQARPLGGRIFIREDGSNKEITLDEWNKRHPDREPIVLKEDGEESSNEVFHAKVTHNLGQMADAAHLGQCLWEPEEIGITKAHQLIEPLRNGLALMKQDPAKFQAMDPANGWGSYAMFVPWIERYLAACEQYPDADVRASR